MKLDEFRRDLLDEIHLDASIGGSFHREAFLERYAGALVEAEEITDFQPLNFEGTGARGKRIQIDGYYFDELDNCLSVVVCPFDDTQEIKILTTSDAAAWFRKARAFIEEARSGFLLENAEESSPGYGLAVDIKNAYANVSRYKIFVLTDMLMSSRSRDIPSEAIDGIPVEYHIWDIQRLQLLLDSKCGKEDIIINLNDFCKGGIPCLEAGHTDDYTAYLCNIPGKVLASLYNTFGGRLLEGNVRSFLTAKGKINKGIRNTILNNPDMFFAYNNGIAATAADVKVIRLAHGDSLVEITGLQIVNGGQTTVSLAMALMNDRDRANDLKNICVPMKLSVLSQEKAEEMIPKIARFANAQNKVSDADFFSNHAFHIRMEEISRRLLAPAVKGTQYGTHWYYERARGQYRQEQARLTRTQKNKFLALNPKSQMFTKTDLAKCHELYRMLPHQVSAGAQKNFMKFAVWATAEWEKNDIVFNEEFFKRIVCMHILFRKTNSLIRKAQWYEFGYKAQVAAYTISMLLYLVQQQHPGMVLDFRSIWSRQRISSAAESQLTEIARRIYERLISPKRGIQNVTEWAKRELCWKEIISMPIVLQENFIRELQPGSIFEDEARDARAAQKQDNDISAMKTVAEYGADNWTAVLDWGRKNRLLTPRDVYLLQSLITSGRGKFPSENQCIRILEILERVRQESYPR